MRAIATSWIALFISVPVCAQEGQISPGKATLVANGVAVDVSVTFSCSVPDGFFSTAVSGNLRQAFKPTKTATIGGGQQDVVCDGSQRTIPVRIFPQAFQGQAAQLFRQGSALADFELGALDPDFNPHRFGGFDGTIKVTKK